VDGQLIPAGLLVTVPVPDTVTVSCGVCVWAKVAVTAVAVFVVIVHALDPLQAPLQPVKVSPAAGDAVSVTMVF
jgi:hypothetical protein